MRIQNKYEILLVTGLSYCKADRKKNLKFDLGLHKMKAYRGSALSKEAQKLGEPFEKRRIHHGVQGHTQIPVQQKKF